MSTERYAKLVEDAARDSPVFRDEHRRANESAKRAGAELVRALKALRELGAAEQQLSDARRAAYGALRDVAERAIPAESPLAAPTQAVLRALCGGDGDGGQTQAQQTQRLSAAVVTEPLQRFADGDARAAGDAHRAYARSCAALETLAGRCCSGKQSEMGFDDARRAHRRAAVASAVAAAAAADRFAVEVAESAALLAVVARNDAQEAADALAEAAGAVAQLTAAVGAERKAISAAVAHANAAKRRIDDAPADDVVEDSGGGESFGSYLWKQSSSLVAGWQRRYFVLGKDGQIFHYTEDGAPRPAGSLDVVLTSVRPRPDLDRRYCFELISPSKTLTLQAETPALYFKWLAVLEAAKTERLEAASKPSSSTSSSSSSAAQQGAAVAAAATATPNASGEGYLDLLSALWDLQPENKVCCDCCAEEPEWISLNIGALFCIQCSGIHRSLGVSVSKVRSLKLDVVDPEVLLLLATLGNKNVNRIFEAELPSGRSKPTKDSKEDVRSAWIRDKYVAKLFIAKDSATKQQHAQKLRDALEADDIPQMQYHLAHGADIDTKFPSAENETLLHCAVSHRRVLAAAFLIFNSAALDVPGRSQFTPLHIAADRNFPEIAAALIKGGASCSKKSSSGETALEIAMRKQHAHVATLLKLAAAVQDEMDAEERSSFLASMRDFERQVKSELFTHDCTVVELIKRTFKSKRFVVEAAACIVPEAVPTRHNSSALTVSGPPKFKPPPPPSGPAPSPRGAPRKPPSPNLSPPSSPTPKTTPTQQRLQARTPPPPPPTAPKPPIHSAEHKK